MMHMEYVRLVLALVDKGCEVRHMDIKTAFLNGELTNSIPSPTTARVYICLDGRPSEIQICQAEADVNRWVQLNLSSLFDD
jgi:hypothetical protein